jgi:CRP/FNR family transcriptional regulator
MTLTSGPNHDVVPESDGVLRALAAVSCFAALDQGALERMARASVRRRYGAGQVVLLEGEPSRGLYVVEQGWLKMVKLNAAGREQTVRTIGPGEHFNEISVFAGTPNLATVVALEPATLWVVARAAVLDLLDGIPGLARTVIEALAHEVVEMIALVEDLSLRSVEGRLARLLTQQAEGSTVPRPRWATQTEIAARLGTVPDVLNRAMRRLSDMGLIKVSRRQIEILDPAGLEDLAIWGG